MFIAAERCAPSIDFQRLQEGSGPEALNPGSAAASPSTWLSATRSPPPRRDQGRLPAGSLPAAGQHRRRHPSKAMPVPGTEPRCDNNPAGGAGPAPPGREKLAAARLCARTRAKGVPRGAPCCRRGICSPPATPVGGRIGPEFWTGGGLTLAVHAEGIQQAGAAELGAQQGHVELHQPRSLAVLGRQLQLAAAHPPARQPPGVPAAPRRLGQEAVHEVQLGLLDAVDERILRGRGRGDTGQCPSRTRGHTPVPSCQSRVLGAPPIILRAPHSPLAA